MYACFRDDLDFVETRGLIVLFNDRDVDNNLKETFDVCIHCTLGSIVKNRLKMDLFKF